MQCNEEIVKITGLFVGLSIKAAMINHFYTIGSNIHKEEEGGSIE